MKKSVVIATHVFSPGTSQALRDYLQDKAEVLFIGHPLFGGNVFTWTGDVLDTIYQVARRRKKFDIYFGSNNLNSFAGILLKKFKIVKKVIFYTPDSPPGRFRSPLLNHIYYWMDYFCVRNCDLVWNNSPTMAEERQKRGIPEIYRTKQIDVPMGTDLLPEVPFNEINRYEIGFVGHLKKGMGVELLIESFKEITKKIPTAKLLIIGSGPIEANLRLQGTGFNIEFTGLISELTEVYQRIRKCAIGIALYEEDSSSQYTDPGKVKLYLSAGLPIVITRVPEIAFEIEKEKCAISVNYDINEVVDAVTKLLSDEELLKAFRNNVKIFAKKYSWDSIFKKALSYLEENGEVHRG